MEDRLPHIKAGGRQGKENDLSGPEAEKEVGQEGGAAATLRGILAALDANRRVPEPDAKNPESSSTKG